MNDRGIPSAWPARARRTSPDCPLYRSSAAPGRQLWGPHPAAVTGQRYGRGVGHNRRARENRLADMSVKIAPWSPDLPVADEYEQYFPISETAGYVLRFEHDEWDRLIEFAVVQMRGPVHHQQHVAV